MANIPLGADIHHAFNQSCPITGGSIIRKALAFHHGVILGFSSEKLRDDFINNPHHFPEALTLIQKAHKAMKNKEYNPRLRWFGRRIGPGMGASDKEAIDNILPLYELAPTDIDADGYLPLKDIFPQKKIWLEVGFGGGEHLFEQAKANPDIGFIGCEPFLNGVASLLKKIKEENLSNIRIWAGDARQLMDVMENDIIDAVFILFADPWPKRRHNRRRFINQENLDQLMRILKQGSLLRFASDHEDYIPWAVGQIVAHPHFEWLAQKPQDWLKEPQNHFETRYQQKAILQDITCRFIHAECCKKTQ